MIPWAGSTRPRNLPWFPFCGWNAFLRFECFACIYVCHMHAWFPWRSEEGIRSHVMSYEWLWTTIWLPWTKSVSSGRAEVRLPAEPSQPVPWNVLNTVIFLRPWTLVLVCVYPSSWGLNPEPCKCFITKLCSLAFLNETSCPTSGSALCGHRLWTHGGWEQ